MKKKKAEAQPGLKSISPGLSKIANAIQTKLGNNKKFLGKKTNG